MAKEEGYGKVRRNAAVSLKKLAFQLEQKVVNKVVNLSKDINKYLEWRIPVT
jgi:hypothetical protein